MTLACLWVSLAHFCKVKSGYGHHRYYVLAKLSLATCGYTAIYIIAMDEVVIGEYV